MSKDKISEALDKLPLGVGEFRQAVAQGEDVFLVVPRILIEVFGERLQKGVVKPQAIALALAALSHHLEIRR